MFTFILMFIFMACAGDRNGQPKIIMVFIADGAGFNQELSAHYYRYGQSENPTLEQFPVKLAMTTFSADGLGYDPLKAWANFEYVLRKPTDSAASATALACGVKTHKKKLGMDSKKNEVENVIERLEAYGKASGVVTSVPFNHATPAGFAIHHKSRYDYGEIAQKMIYDSPLEVIMGAGNPYYDDDGKRVDDADLSRIGGEETWRDLVSGNAGNDADGDGDIDMWRLVQTAKEFKALMNGKTPERVFGLATVRSTLQHNRSGDPKAPAYAVPFNDNVPKLSEMTRAALNILEEDPDGFFLMVEGGAVDWAGHGNNPGRLIEEKIAFDKAVEKAVQWVEDNSSWDETLIIVTADHETGYLLGAQSAADDDNADREEIWPAIENNGKGQMPTMVFHSVGHTNGLVPFYARGAGSDRFYEHKAGGDSVYGAYIDNTSVAALIKSIFPKK